MRNTLILLTVLLLINTASAANNRERGEHPGELLGRLLEPLDLKIKVGQKITDMQLPDLSGNPVNTQELRKGKILLVRVTKIDDAIWAKQIQIFNQIADKFLDKVVMLDIVTKDLKTNEKILEKYEQENILYSVVIDKDGTAAAQFGLSLPDDIPAVLLFDIEGRLITSSRMVDFESVKLAVEDVLKSTRPR